MQLISQLRLHARLKAVLDKLFPPPGNTWQHIRQNLIIGLLVVCVLNLLQESDSLRAGRERSIDWLTSMQRGITVAEGRDFRPFVFYDIDDATHTAWGEPFHVPRPQLAALIERALLRKPAVLVIDVELQRPSDDDQALLDLLRQQASLAETTTLVFLRSFRWQGRDSGTPHLFARPSFLDNKLPRSQFQAWASPLFERDPDGQIRRWQPWQLACAPDGSALLTPSVQMEALAVTGGTTATQQMNDALAAATPASCLPGTSLPGTTFTIGKHRFSPEADRYGQRILYTLPWRLEADEARPLVDFASRPTRLLSILPARAVLEGGVLPEVPPGHIAIIGASNEDARDIHMTPLGPMPGSLILINAIHSLLQHGQLSPPSIWLQLASAALLLVIVSLIFVRFPSVNGRRISFAAIIVLLVPLSMYFFRYGIWLDFIFPLSAVKIFQSVMDHRKKISEGDDTHAV